MRLQSITAVMAAFLLCAATGCHLGAASRGCDAGPYGCDSSGGGGCASGSCGGLVGILGGLGHGGGCQGDSCGSGCPDCVSPAALTADGYGVRGGLGGPLAQHIGKHHRGPQSHMGGMPGPADGPPAAQVTYPYYTFRGPRDFFLDNPASIGP